jgi:hypothetical protein
MPHYLARKGQSLRLRVSGASTPTPQLHCINPLLWVNLVLIDNNFGAKSASGPRKPLRARVNLRGNAHLWPRDR